VLVDIFAINPPARDQDVRQSVKQGEIGLRFDGVVLARGHSGLGLTGIDHDDLWVILVLANALPHDRMRDAEVRANENECVGFLEILIGVRRRVEPERFFVSRCRGRHTLTGVAVAVNYPETELGQRAKERQFLCADLASAEPRDRILAILILDGFQAQGEDLQRCVPVHRFKFACRVAQARGGCAITCAQWRERLPALRASHPEVDWIIGCRTQVDGLAAFEMNFQTAAG
jgi:hypothetical protein